MWVLTARMAVVAAVVAVAVLPTATARRRAKMPDFGDGRTLRHYERYRAPNTITSSGFKMPASVNHLKVKTNSTNPYKNEKNVTLNLNIPASVSGFLLEEIDLKYVKKNKNRKKSLGSKKSNLLIKYFTNRSSNLHLSSVTKQEVDSPDLYPEGDLKERRDQDSNDINDRPFKYLNKYPLKLLEKSARRRNQFNTIRRGKFFNNEIDENSLTLSAEDDSKQPSEELSESDLLALESILSSKAVVKAGPDTRLARRRDELPPQSEVDLNDAFTIFEKVANTSHVHDSDGLGETVVRNEKKPDIDFTRDETSNTVVPRKMKENRSWFANLFSKIPSFKGSIFDGSGFIRRHRRSIPVNHSIDYKKGVKLFDEKLRKNENNFIKNADENVYDAPVSYSDN